MTSKTLKLGLLAVLAIGAIIMTGCDGECSTCVADPFAKQDSSGAWVAKPTAQPVQKVQQQVENAVKKADAGVTQLTTGSSAPKGKQLIETIGALRPTKELNDFADRCGRFGGAVASTGTQSQLGCYK